jgi:hypothetical protein
MYIVQTTKDVIRRRTEMERQNERTEAVQHSVYIGAAHIGRMSPRVIFLLWFGFISKLLQLVRLSL